jgi:long-chain acyl-CoA synthetase
MALRQTLSTGTSESSIIFFNGGHNHNGVSSALIDVSKYSLYDFTTDFLGTSARQEGPQAVNYGKFKQVISRIVKEDVLTIAGIKLLPNEVKAENITAGAITADKLSANIVLINNVIRSNNFDGTVLANGTITSYGTTGWAILAGAITIPIFNNISEDNLFYELIDSDAKFFFTDNEKICAKIKEKFPEIIIIGYGFKSTLSINFEDLLQNEESAVDNNIYVEELFAKIKNDDIATIVYTSGSTDRPKGVEISHQALISQIKDSETFFHLDNFEVVLSYLPLAHIFERMVMMYYISKGLTINFVDDIKNLGSFLKEIKPNLMTSVPRALEKVFARINNGIEEASFFKKIIGRKALKRALKKDPLTSKNFLDKIFDKIIYQKFRQAMGGEMRMIICGGSALSKELERFYWNIGVKIYCGYGLTECSPVLATNAPHQHKFTSVGKAFPSVKLKIAEDGELLASGINVMKKYHNNPQNIHYINKHFLF